MIKLTYGSFNEHNAQILTGFDLLTKGACQIAPYPNEELPHSVVLADVDGRGVAYDTCDGYFHTNAIGTDERYRVLSGKAPILYKRDFNAALNREQLLYTGEIRPLGLNYLCCDSRIKRLYHPGYRMVKRRMKELLGYEGDVDWRNFETDPSQTEVTCDVLFLTRLWDPEAPEVENREIAEERRQVNAMRMAVIREMRRRYGSRAVCGLNDDPFARSTAPELIVPNITRKAAYLQMMKGAKVAVTSLGLHRSNGFRTGEYIAAGRAVVMEKPYYEIPFAESGRNWLEYTDARECMEAVEELLSDESRRKEMEEANRAFYNRHLRPDQLIRDTLTDMEKERESRHGRHTNRTIPDKGGA